MIRESGGDRSADYDGAPVISGTGGSGEPPPVLGEISLDRMIALVEGAERQKTPNEIALNTLLRGSHDIVFLISVAHAAQPARLDRRRRLKRPAERDRARRFALPPYPDHVGGLLSAIGIAGMDRLVRRNVLALSGRAVEAAGDCSTLLLDKTGTITLGNHQATEFVPLQGVH